MRTIPLRVQRRDAADGSEVRTVRRQDRGGLLRYQVRPDGSILAEGYAARSTVMVYKLADGSTFREWIPPEQLSRADSLASLGRAAMTLHHPPEDVSPENYAKYGTGDVDGEVVYEEAGGYVKVRIAIRRKDAIEAFLSEDPATQIRELSPGYTCRLRIKSGITPDGEAYDGIQEDRVYNHLAQVREARGGHDVALRADEARATLPIPLPDGGSLPDPVKVDDLAASNFITIRRDSSAGTSPRPEVSMDPRLIALLMTIGVPAALASDLDTGLPDAQRRLDEKAKADGEKNYDELLKERDRLKADMKEMKKDEEGDEEEEQKKADAIHAAALARTPLLQLAKSLKMDSAEVAKMDNASLQKAIVLKKYPDLTERADSLSSDYFQARCDSIQVAATGGSGWEGLNEVRDPKTRRGIQRKRNDDRDAGGDDGLTEEERQERRDSQIVGRNDWHKNMDEAFEAEKS